MAVSDNAAVKSGGDRRRAFIDALIESIGDISEGVDQTMRHLTHLLEHLGHDRVAELLESVPPKTRRALWQLLEVEREGEILHYLHEETRAEILKDMEAKEVTEVIKDMESDDIADILQQLPETVTVEVLRSMSRQDRARVERVLDYPDDSAGGLMNTDTVTVPLYFTVDAVFRHLRQQEKLPKTLNKLFVVDRDDKFLGALHLDKLLVADTSATVRSLMDRDAIAIDAQMSASDVTNLFERHDLVSAPVIEDNGRLLGRITIDDVVNVMRAQADKSLLGRVGLSNAEEDTFTPALRAAPRRLTWMGINLLTAFAAAATIGLFADVLEKVVALAVLMPIVASMGGIMGTQILTVMERGFARGQISGINLGWFYRRELLLAIMNGVVWALLVGLVALWWFDQPIIGVLIAAALLMNLLLAALVGVFLPSLLRLLGIDPALAGSVALTTITDVGGFFMFLGLATLAFG